MTTPSFASPAARHALTSAEDAFANRFGVTGWRPIGAHFADPEPYAIGVISGASMPVGDDVIAQVDAFVAEFARQHEQTVTGPDTTADGAVRYVLRGSSEYETVIKVRDYVFVGVRPSQAADAHA